MAVDPRPPEPAWTRTFWPGFTWPRSTRACHLVADLEVAYGGADPGHHAGDVVTEHERCPVLQELLELAVADHLVQRVEAGVAHLDRHVTVANVGLRYVGGAQSVLAVPLDDECLHDRSSSQRNSRARLTKSSWNWNTPPCPASG
jgi:hypothetical protein